MTLLGSSSSAKDHHRSSHIRLMMQLVCDFTYCSSVDKKG